jgi:hypothetical protein
MGSTCSIHRDEIWTQPEGKGLGNLGTAGRVTMQWILKKYGVRVWTGAQDGIQ